MAKDEYQPPICKLAQFLYKKDIVCGVSSCPLNNKTCPKLILEDALNDSSDAMEELIISYLEKGD